MVDTNILLDWLIDRDTAHTERIDELLATTEQLHIPDAIIVELAFALEKFYGLPRSLVVDNLHKVLDEAVFNCNRNLFRRAIQKYTTHPAWSFLDACLLIYSDLQDARPVYTFDRKLIAQGGGSAVAPTA